MAITRTGVLISTNTTFGDSDDQDFYISGGHIGTNQVPVSGLTPDTVYYAKGYVQQDGSTITDPSYRQFRTRASVEYLKITNNDSSANTVNFTTHSGSGLTPVVLEYSVDNGTTWDRLQIGPSSASATIPANGEMLLKGLNATLNGQYSYFKIVVSNANISGDINTLLNEVGGDMVLPAYAFHNLFASSANTLTFNGLKLPSTSVSESAYESMLYQCVGLTAQPTMPSAIKLTGKKACTGMFAGCTGLPSFSTKITFASNEGCSGMFNGCTRLATVPSDMLQDNDLSGKDNCYFGMFKNCVSLSTPPNLPATTLSDSCYYGMFEGCTGIISAQSALPAKTLERASYTRMFYGCTALVNPPALPADKLAGGCYNQMFYGCTSLQASPTLNASMLYTYSFKEMFYNCRALKEVHIYLGDVSATDCLNNWLYGVAASGIFYWDSSGSNPINTIPLNSASGCPSGWTRASY